MSKLNPEPFKSNKSTIISSSSWFETKKLNSTSKILKYIEPKIISFRLTSIGSEIGIDLTAHLLDSNTILKGSINWGDGNIEDFTTEDNTLDTTFSHTYAQNGEYKAYFRFENAELMDELTIGNCSAMTNIDCNWRLFPELANLQIISVPITSFTFMPRTFEKLELFKLSDTSITSLTIPLEMPILQTLNLSENSSLTSFSFSYVYPQMTTFSMLNCHLGVSAVNSLLVYLNTNRTKYVGSGKTVNLSQNPDAIPTGSGATAKTTLNSNGWTVTTDVISS